jgi:hypothetical protein
MERKTNKQLTLRNTASNPLSEEQIVEATIAYANGASVTLLDCVPGLRGAISSSAATQKLLADAESLVPTKAETRTLKALGIMRAVIEKDGIPEFEKRIGAARRELIQGHLKSIVSGEFDAEDRAMYLDNDEFFGAISPRLYLRKTHRGIAVALYYAFADLFSVVRLGSFFLDDNERPFGKKLCQCELKSCGLFFFEVKPPTGRPQRRYCLKEHMLEAHNLNAVKRMEKHRSKPAMKHK